MRRTCAKPVVSNVVSYASLPSTACVDLRSQLHVYRCQIETSLCVNKRFYELAQSLSVAISQNSAKQLRGRNISCKFLCCNCWVLCIDRHQVEPDQFLLLNLTPDRAKSKIYKFPKISNWVKLKNKQHHSKVLLDSFPMNDHTLGFCP